MKGAPQVVLRRAHNHAAICDAVEARIRDFAARLRGLLGWGGGVCVWVCTCVEVVAWWVDTDWLLPWLAVWMQSPL